MTLILHPFQKNVFLQYLNNTETEQDVHPYLRLKTKTRNQEYKGKIHTNMLSFSKRDSPIHCENYGYTKS